MVNTRSRTQNNKIESCEREERKRNLQALCKIDAISNFVNTISKTSKNKTSNATHMDMKHATKKKGIFVSIRGTPHLMLASCSFKLNYTLQIHFLLVSKYGGGVVWLEISVLFQE